MATSEFKQELWERLTELQPSHKRGESQLSVRCPFCGDSKHHDSTHLYIRINIHEDEPIIFNCFICGTSGFITPSVLRSLEINDLHVNSSLIRYNKNAMKNMKHTIGVFNNEFDFVVPLSDPNDERNIFKKEYFEGRLGIKTTFEELAELKVILKMGQFLKVNGIEKITTTKEKAIALHDNYLGFVSTKNEFINFRQVYESPYKRYEKYSIFKNLDNTRKFYTIPNEIDLLTTKKITINIAEGSFDILGVYYHIFEKEKKNMIYSGVTGSGYLSVIKYFIQMGVIDNVDVNIFSDDDKDKHFYKKMIRELKPWVNDFHLYYNEKSKDFGVPKSKIKQIKKKL